MKRKIPTVLSLLGVFAVALLLRAAHILQIQHSPLASLKICDAASYDAWARQIAAGNWLGDQVFYQAPLYPYFLGALYSVFGDSMLVVRIVQALIGAASCVFIALAGRRIFSARIGILAGLLLACYAPAIFYDGLMQKTVLDTFLLSLGLCILGGIVENPGRVRWGSLGLVMGALALTRENALIIAAVMLLWLFHDRRFPWVRHVAFAACFLAGMSVLLLPVGVRNKAVGGEFHLTTSQFGPNFYIGNNEKADGLYQPLLGSRDNPLFEREDATEIAQEAEGRKLSPAEVSRYWTRRALSFIRTQPLAWLGLMLRKLGLAINAMEIFDAEDFYTYAEWSMPLRWLAPLFNFGLLAPLAVFGIWATWDCRGRVGILYLIPASYLASLSLFFIFGRYRFPLVPSLVLLASAGLMRARRVFRERSAANIAIGAALTAGAVILCNLPLIDKIPMRATTHYNIGAVMFSRGNCDAAAGEFLAALELDPEMAIAHNNLGLIRLARGDIAQAAGHFQKALDITPDYTEALFNLGLVKLRSGNVQEADRYLKNVFHLDLQDPQVRSALGGYFPKLENWCSGRDSSARPTD